MWPFYTLKNEIVTINIRPDMLVCAWITPTARNTQHYTLRAYKRIPITNFACAQGILFNPTLLSDHISQFLDVHNLTDAFITCSTTGSHITEFIFDTHSASPAVSEFPLQKLSKQVWEYQYIYPKDNARYALYVSGMSRELLAQYQLLAITLNLNMVVLTTEFMTHLEVYKNLYGKAFRRAQLARDMIAHNNQLLNVLTTDTIRRALTTHPTLNINIELEKEYLITAFGLFLTGKNI